MTRPAKSGRIPVLLVPLVLVAVGANLLVPSGEALAHGSMTYPSSRTHACYVDGQRGGGGGDLAPTNPACVAAVTIGGKQPLWDWFGNLISNAGGRHREIIADGDLCGPSTKYDAYNLPRTDWPSTTLTSGAPITFRYNAWAPHPGTWTQYLTRDGFDPGGPLRWSDLDPAFDSVTNPPLANGEYSWNAQLPSKSGRHILYSVWQRSDSPEAFYSCSDVVFSGGGNGGGADTVAPSAPGTPSASATTASTARLSWTASTDAVGVVRYEVYREAGTTDALVVASASPSADLTGLAANTAYVFYVVAVDAAGNRSPASPTVSLRTASGAGTCAVAYSRPSSWPGGHTASVTLRNTGPVPLAGWQLSWDVPAGQTLSQAWSAEVTITGGTATARGVSWNATLAPGASTTFGYNAATTGAAPTPVVFTLGGATCTT